MTMPNFLIIGAAKAGSSALYHYMRQHPDVFMPEMKEPGFFGLEGRNGDYRGPEQGMNRKITTLEDYQALFQGAEGKNAIGEATTYIHSPTAPAQILHYIPSVRMLAILRHPADRAFSSYSHLLRDGLETGSFEHGLEEEENRMKAMWSPLYAYLGQGFYYVQLKRFFDLFPREQLRIYLHEELNADSARVVRDAFEFVGVDPGFTPDLPRINVSGLPRSRLVYNLFRKDNPVKSTLKPFFPQRLRRRVQDAVRRHNLGPKPAFSPETRHRLTEVFREDILKLQDLIGRDLSHWLAEDRLDSRDGDGGRGSVPRATA